MANENLPVVVDEKTRKLNEIKEKLIRAGKAIGYSALTGGLVMGAAVFPVAFIPAIAGATFTGLKVLNNTKYKEYKDLAFKIRKSRNNIEINQDSTQFKVLKELRNMNNIEKIGFLQLQTIVGLTKMQNTNKYGEKYNISTVTHGINIKTLEKLQDLGYIENLQSEFFKNRSIPMESLAFGNIKGLFDKKDFYKLSFNRTDKPIDINDEELKKAFKVVFGKKGIVNTKGYSLEYDEEGRLNIDFNPKTKIKEEQISIDDKGNKEKHKEFVENVKEEAEKEQEQYYISQDIQENRKQINKDILEK